MMIGVAMYVLMQMGGAAPSNAVVLTAPQPTWEIEANGRIRDLNEQLTLAKEPLELAETPFGGPGSNMPISSYDPAMFPMLTVPGDNCSSMPIYAWHPHQAQEPQARLQGASTFVPQR